MKKLFTVKMKAWTTALHIMALVGVLNVSAQNDTVFVSNGADLFEVVGAEMDNSGMLNNHVFVLSQGGVYFLTDIINVNDDITLLGEEGDGVPPFVLPRKSGNNEYVSRWFHCEGVGQVFTAKNIIFQFLTSDGISTGVAVKGLVDMVGDNARIILDNCVFNGGGNNTLSSLGNGQYVKITNCNFRNNRTPSDDWSGGALYAGWSSTGGGWRDSLIFENNTMSNIGNSGIIGYWGEISKAIIINHNTFFGTTRGCVFAGFQANVTITNNMFVGWESSGIPKSRYEQYYQDSSSVYDTVIYNPGRYEAGSVYSMYPIGIDALGPMHDVLGIDTTGGLRAAHSQRTWTIRNNCIYWPKQLIEAWDTIDEDGGAEVPYISMTYLDSALFKMAPMCVVENTYGHMGSEDAKTSTFDPGFDQAVIDRVFNPMITWLDGFRNQPGWTPYLTNIDDPGKEFQLAWPLPENYAYTNETLKTAGTDGLPLGDLNWFENVTGIKHPKELATETLTNFPNPFTGSTTIYYRIEHAAPVELSVYDISGKEVTVLVREQQVPGEYTIHWNGTDDSGQALPGGIYIYRLQNGVSSKINKMIKLK